MKVEEYVNSLAGGWTYYNLKIYPFFLANLKIHIYSSELQSIHLFGLSFDVGEYNNEDVAQMINRVSTLIGSIKTWSTEVSRLCVC